MSVCYISIYIHFTFSAKTAAAADANADDVGVYTRTLDV